MDSYELIDDGIAEAPEETEDTHDSRQAVRSGLPKGMTVVDPVDTSENPWNAPYISESPYKIYYIDHKLPESQTIAERVRPAVTVLEDGTIDVQFFYEKVHRSYYAENNQNQPNRELSDAFQSGIKISGSAIFANEDGPASNRPSDEIMDYLYPNVAASERPSLSVDGYDFLVDEDGYKIGLDGKVMVEPRDYIVTHYSKRLTLYPLDGRKFTDAQFANLTPEDIQLADQILTYDFQILKDRVSVQEHSLKTVDVPVAVSKNDGSQEIETVRFEAKSIPYGSTIRSLKTEPKEGWDTTEKKDGTIVKKAVITLPTQKKSKVRYVTKTEQVLDGDQNETQIITTEVRKPSGIGNYSGPSEYILIEEVTLDKANSDTVRERYVLIDNNQPYRIEKVIEDGKVTINTDYGALMAHQVHNINDQGEISEPVEPVLNYYNENAFGNVFWGAGFEMGFGSKSVYVSDLSGQYFTPYLSMGIRQYTSQGNGVDTFIAPELFVDGLGQSTYGEGDTLGSKSNFGGRLHATYNIADAEKRMWSFGIGGRVGMVTYKPQEGDLSIGSTGYRAQVNGLGADVRYGPIGQLEFFGGGLSLLGGYEWLAKGNVRAHYYENVETGEPVDFDEMLPSQGNHIVVGATIRPVELVKAFKK